MIVTPAAAISAYLNNHRPHRERPKVVVTPELVMRYDEMLREVLEAPRRGRELNLEV